MAWEWKTETRLCTATDVRPEYVYAPAFVTMEQFQSMENYHTLEAAWRKLDVAIVNIGNYPSAPDFASEDRYDY